MAIDHVPRLIVARGETKEVAARLQAEYAEVSRARPPAENIEDFADYLKIVDAEDGSSYVSDGGSDDDGSDDDGSDDDGSDDDSEGVPKDGFRQHMLGRAKPSEKEKSDTRRWRLYQFKHPASKSLEIFYIGMVVIEDLETARAFFQEVSNNVLICIQRISITINQSTIVHNPYDALQVLQQIAGRDPRGEILKMGFNIRKINNDASGIRTFRIKESRPWSARLGPMWVHLTLRVRLDIHDNAKFGLHDVTDWLRKRDALIIVAPGPPVNFLKRLPTELRDLIYGFVAFPGGEHSEYWHRSNRHLKFRGESRKRWQDFVRLLLVNRQMSAEIKDFVSRTRVFSLWLSDYSRTSRFLEDLAWFVRRMPAYIVSGIREVQLTSRRGTRPDHPYGPRCIITFEAALMPLVNTIVSNFGRIQEQYTLAPTFTLNEAALFHCPTQPLRSWDIQSWSSLKFVADNIEPRIKFLFESTLGDADWPSVYSTIHPPDVCAEKCRDHHVGYDEYCSTTVLTDWQSSPVLKKYVESVVQSIKLNLEGYATEIDKTYSLVHKGPFKSEGEDGQIPLGYFPLARFQPRQRKPVRTNPTTVWSYSHNWNLWSKANSEPDNSEHSSQESYYH
ncbi:hypothetical protein MMC18_005256 [Xylographa bjoerkii]|nr:hypothetical protein [Xylographa bjoerkii]